MKLLVALALLLAACSSGPGFSTGASGTLAGLTPSPIVATPVSTTFVYRVGSNADQLVYASVDLATGALAEHGSISLGAGSAPTALAVTPDKRFLYVANGGSNSISLFNLNGTTGVATFAAASPTLASPIGLLMDPLGRFLFCLEGSEILSYVIGGTGGLTWTGTTTIGSGARAIATDAAGRVLYKSSTGSGINSYSINQTDGELSSPGTLDAVAATSMKVNPATTRLFAPSYGNGDVLSYAVDPVGGRETFTRFISTGNSFPYYDLTFDASGAYVYLLNNYLGLIEAYTVDATAGQIALLNRVTLPSGCLPKSLNLLASGAYLITACTDGSGRTITYAVKPDGSLDTTSAQTSIVSGLVGGALLSVN